MLELTQRRALLAASVATGHRLNRGTDHRRNRGAHERTYIVDRRAGLYVRAGRSVDPHSGRVG